MAKKETILRHECDYDEHHYIRVDNKVYLLMNLLSLNEKGIIPCPIEELSRKDTPVEVLSSLGLIAQGKYIKMKAKERERILAKSKKAKRAIGK